MTTPEVRVVGDWHDALNSGDLDRLVALSHPEVEVGGPRGTGRGTQLLREWVERANIRLRPRRLFHGTETVVVEEDAKWHADGSGEATGSQTVASVLVVRDGQVSSVVRYPDLASALAAARLDASQEI